jgi:hypothetical protein
MAKVDTEAEAKAKVFKVYQFRQDRGNAFLEALRTSFRVRPTMFQPRWRCQDVSKEEREGRERNILHVGRRMLEIATENAKAANTDEGPAFTDWKRTGELAEEAGYALNRLINHLVAPHEAYLLKPQGKKLEREQKPIKEEPPETRLQLPLLQILLQLTHREAQDKSAEQLLEQSRAMAQALSDTNTLLNKIPALCTARQARQNPGNPQKMAFAKEMIRGWVFLFGRPPAPGNATCAGYLSAAWSDICEDEEHGWPHAIREASGLISNEVVSLREKGPTWL